MPGGVAAVLGGASGGLAELASVQFDAVFAVNDAAAEYAGELAEFVTLHPEKLPQWITQRRTLGLSEPGEVVAHVEAPHVTVVDDYRWPGMNASGSSGLFAVKRALLRFDRVILCGVPMQASRAHYFNSAAWDEVEAFRDAWTIARPFLKNVRSCSGWTAELLGTPNTP